MKIEFYALVNYVDILEYRNFAFIWRKKCRGLLSPIQREDPGKTGEETAVSS